MGTILSCFQFTHSHSKPSATTSTPETGPNSIATQQSQTYSSPLVEEAQRGPKDELLASLPPPTTTSGKIAAAEVAEATREAGLQAPVPIPTVATTTQPVNHTTTNNTITKEIKEDKMASDEDYMAFLDKANQDPNEGTAKEASSGGGKVELKATDKGISVPQVLKKATEEAFYVSDADEPFVPVCLKLEKGKGLPDEATFAQLVSHPSPGDAGVEIMDIAEWDTQGQYKELVDAVREASKGSDVRVYRIGKGGPRVEYWVVGVVEGRLVGVKALAIES